MIPKIIHYCWLSNDTIPEQLQMCMESWKKYLPDYEFMLWNFERFPKSKSKWVMDAFDNKKYAFAADYIRLYALYNFGGIYLDMDVEVLKPYGNLLTLNTMLGYENFKTNSLEVAAFGVEPKSNWVKVCLDHYDERNFVNEDGSFNDQPLPGVIKYCLINNGYEIKSIKSLEEAQQCLGKIIPVFPCDYFSPKNHVTGKIEKTKNTFTIHHFSGSWEPLWQQVERKFWHKLGLRNYRILLRIHNLFLYGSIKSVPEKLKSKRKI